MTRRAHAISAAVAAALLLTGVAWASGLTLSARHLGASAATTPAMYPVWLALNNKSGGGGGKAVVGQVQTGDSMTFAWSQPIDETTLCSGWSNSSSSQSLTLQWSVVNGAAGGHDMLQVTGSSPTCVGGFHVGSIDLGAAGYDTSTTSIDFPTSTMSLSVAATSTTLTVTLNGQIHGAAGTVSSGSAAIWTPDPALKDRTGRTCGSNLAASSTTVQF
jgi:hypothetical protein